MKSCSVCGFTEPVAPFTGAWIETVDSNATASDAATVAPFTGAWIETARQSVRPHLVCQSHPLRVRGLKPLGSGNVPVSRMSHPLRVRGLKPEMARIAQLSASVAPFTGATIKLLSRFNPLFSSGLYRKVPIISGTSRPFFHQPPSETVTGFFGRTASRRSAPIQRKRYRKNIRNPAGNGNRLPDSPVPA